jgi:SET domain-containing protein
MLLVKTYLRPSAIEGLGVFAAEPILRGTMIWALDPKFDICVVESELDRLPPQMRDYITRYSYPHLERPGVLILDSDNGKFMNHSDRPNTDFRRFDRAYALIDIAVGEELTCNYHEFDPSFTGFFPAPPPRRGRLRRSNGKPVRN